MSLTQAQCTNCGANLSVDSAKEAAVCNFCGSAFIVEKAINNYNIANAQISAGVVNVYNTSVSDFDIEGGMLKKYKGNDKNVVVPNTVKIIESEALKGNLNIESVTIPDSVERIKKHAFQDCKSLKDVRIEGDIDIFDYAFERCQSLKALYIAGDAWISDIGEVFKRCENLESVHIIGNVEVLKITYYPRANLLIRIEGNIGSLNLAGYKVWGMGEDSKGVIIKNSGQEFPVVFEEMGSMWGFSRYISSVNYSHQEGLQIQPATLKLSETSYHLSSSVADFGGIRQLTERQEILRKILSSKIPPKGVVINEVDILKEVVAVLEPRLQAISTELETKQQWKSGGLCAWCGGKVGLLNRKCKSCGKDCTK